MVTNLAQKKKKQTDGVTQKKWTRKDEFVASLIAYIKEYKAVCDFNGVDFEADLKDLYTELHRCLASRFPEDFGPDKVSEPSTAVKDMSCEEYDLYKKTTAEEKIKIAKVYDRIKAKVKSIRQDYRTAVNKGTRSGSGKLVKEHFDILREIWGGSPATTMLAEGVDGDSLLSDKVKSSSEVSEADATLTEELSDTDKESAHGNASSSFSQVPADEPKMTKKPNMSVSAVPRLVDNKRKQMEKALSQSKRDQIFMNATKEDIIMKKQMISSLEESNKSLQSTMQKMTESLSSMAEGISAGMRMIAMAMASPSQQQSWSSQPPDYNRVLYPTAMHGTHAYTMGHDFVRSPPNFPGEDGHFQSSSPRSYTPSPTPSDQVSVHSNGSSTAGYASYNSY